MAEGEEAKKCESCGAPLCSSCGGMTCDCSGEDKKCTCGAEEVEE